jgi:hypothetical protein
MILFICVNIFLVLLSSDLCFCFQTRFTNAKESASTFSFLSHRSSNLADLIHRKHNTLGYKNVNEEDEYYDSTYPIPVGTLTLPKEHSFRVVGKSMLRLPRTSNFIVDDDSYYPIPVRASMAIDLTTTTSVEDKLNESTKVQPDPSITGRKPIITQIHSFQELCDYLRDDDRLAVIK